MLETQRPQHAATELVPDLTTGTPAATIAPRRRKLHRWMPALDVVVALLAILVTMPLATASWLPSDAVAGQRVAPFSVAGLVIVAIAVAGLFVGALYRERTSDLTGGLDTFLRLLVVAAVTTWISYLLFAALGDSIALAQAGALTLVLPIGWGVERSIVTRAAASERVLVLGSGVVALHLVDLVGRHPDRGIEIVGLLDDDPHDLPDNLPLLGSLDDLSTVLESQRIDRVIVAFSLRTDREMLSILRRCDRHGVEVDVVPRLFDLMGPQTRVRSFGGLSLLEVPAQRPGIAARAGKRAFDLCVSSLMLLVLSPVMLTIAALIAIRDGRPVLFRQDRIGRNARPFTIYKFRTMVNDAREIEMRRIEELKQGGLSIDEAVAALKDGDDPRITPLGRFLRRTSLDELPQLLNVVNGTMSLVGPRPLRDFEVDSLAGWQRRRQMVRPGVTGLWQILGRSEVEWDERMQLDYVYVRHWSLTADLRILARTVTVVLRRKGAV